MKNKFLLLTLLLSNNILFGAQGGAESSLKQICFKNIIDILNKENSDPIKMNICEAILTNQVPERLINELEHYITTTAAHLWIEHRARMSPLSLLQEHRPDLAHFTDSESTPWKLSLQDLINAGGGDILASKIVLTDGLLTGNFDNLSLTSLEGLQNIPNITQTEQLFLDNNQLTTIHPDTFNGLAQLQFLDLSNNQLTTIHSDTFNGLIQLRDLSLNNNQLTTIHPDTFNGLDQLQWLYLEHNQLTTIHSDTFNGLIQLIWINLEHNQLTTVASDTFNGLIRLENLSLNDNQLTTIDPDTFKDLTQLEELSLYNNQLSQEQVDLIRSQLPVDCDFE